MEFKKEDMPKTVEQIAAFAVGLLNADTGEKWDAIVETEGWDAYMKLKQGEFVYLINYSAGDKLLHILIQVASAYLWWEKAHERNVSASKMEKYPEV